MLGRNGLVEKQNRLLSEEAGGLKTYLSARWSFFGPEPDHQRSDDRKERFHSKSESSPKGIGRGLGNSPFGPVVVFPVLNQFTKGPVFGRNSFVQNRFQFLRE